MDKADIKFIQKGFITASINKLNESDASAIFLMRTYFTILSAEPIDPDGTSPFGSSNRLF